MQQHAPSWDSILAQLDEIKAKLDRLIEAGKLHTREAPAPEPRTTATP